MDDVVVKVTLVSPFRVSTGQRPVIERERRLDAGAARDVILQNQAELEDELFAELDEIVGWPVDRSRVRFIIREPRI